MVQADHQRRRRGVYTVLVRCINDLPLMLVIFDVQLLDRAQNRVTHAAKPASHVHAGPHGTATVTLTRNLQRWSFRPTARHDVVDLAGVMLATGDGVIAPRDIQTATGGRVG